MDKEEFISYVKEVRQALDSVLRQTQGNWGWIELEAQ